MTLPPMLTDFADRWKRDRTALAAAGVTYHWFLAVFPLLFAVVATITLLGNAISERRGSRRSIPTCPSKSGRGC